MYFNNLYYVICIGGKTPDIGSRTYTEIMREQMLKGEEMEVCYYTPCVFLTKFY